MQRAVFTTVNTSIIIACILVACGPGSCAQAQEPEVTSQAIRADKVMNHRATGAFEVKVIPQAADAGFKAVARRPLADPCSSEGIFELPLKTPLVQVMPARQACPWILMRFGAERREKESRRDFKEAPLPGKEGLPTKKEPSLRDKEGLAMDKEPLLSGKTPLLRVKGATWKAKERLLEEEEGWLFG